MALWQIQRMAYGPLSSVWICRVVLMVVLLDASLKTFLIVSARLSQIQQRRRPYHHPFCEAIRSLPFVVLINVLSDRNLIFHFNVTYFRIFKNCSVYLSSQFHSELLVSIHARILRRFGLPAITGRTFFCAPGVPINKLSHVRRRVTKEAYRKT